MNKRKAFSVERRAFSVQEKINYSFITIRYPLSAIRSLRYVLCLLPLVLASEVQALKISDFYQEAEVGQWILMKSSDGLLTRTAVVAKGEGFITLRIQSYDRDRLISDAQELIDVKAGRIVSIRTEEEGSVREIIPDKTEADDFFQIDFRRSGEERLAVKKGVFQCKRYRGLYKDRVVRAWLADEVPILRLVKISMRGVSVQLVDYGG